MSKLRISKASHIHREKPPAPGFKNGHDIAPLIATQGNKAFQPPEVIEHKAMTVEKEKERIKQKTTKSDRFMRVFTSYRLFYDRPC